MNYKHIKRSWIRQHDQSDCGIACLAMLITYHGGEYSYESLREHSGTTTQGTTLLGIYQSGMEAGFEVEGFEGSMAHLKDLESPTLLHVLMEGRLQHYIVCFGFKEGKFIIGDPAVGVVSYTEAELDTIWVSKTLLTFRPTERFVPREYIRKSKLSWLSDLVREDYTILWLALFLGVFISVIGLATAIFSQKLIDIIIPESDFRKLTLGLVLLFIVLLIRSGLNYIRGQLLNTQSRDFNIRIIDRFYGALLYLPKTFFDSRKTGELVARMNDTLRIQNVISSVIGNIVIDGLVLLVSIGFLFTYTWEVGVLCILAIPVYAVLVWHFNDKIIRSQKNVMAAYAHNESNYIDTIQGIEVIKGYNVQSEFKRTNYSIYENFQGKVFALGKLNIAYNLITEVIGAALVVSVITVASLLVLHDKIQLGELVAVLSISGSIIPAVNRLISSNIKVQEAHVAFNRMFEFTNLKPEQQEGDGANTLGSEAFYSLDVKALSFRFPGSRLLLDSISLHLPAGGFVALLGESGSGKSTLLDIFQRFYTYDAGEVSVNGVSFNDMPVKEWRETIGVVPQHIKIFNGTVLDNIGLDYTNQEAAQIVRFCEALGFNNFFQALPQGYLTLLGENGVKLSGGQQQLIALARALYRKPKILFLDEATSALDKNTERFVLELLMRLKGKVSVFMITHRVENAAKADYIYILEKGRIEHSGTHASLMLTENFYSQYWADLLHLIQREKVTMA